MRKKTAREKIDDYRKGIAESVSHWKSINENGCSDPAWADGCNMNLVRNHILYYKKKISQLCSTEGFRIPEEYYMPTPPEVDDNFMANLKQKDRVKRLREYGSDLTTGKVGFNETQLSLF